MLAACSGATLDLWVPAGEVFTDQSVELGWTPQVAAFNRNNRVVAVGGEKGVALHYANGEKMSSLPGTGDMLKGAEEISCLSWSSGSRQLAAGSSMGKLYVHNMTTKASTDRLLLRTWEKQHLGS